MTQLDKCRKLILDYFKNNKLQIKDKDRSVALSPYARTFYRGVTIPYIFTYVIKECISLDDLIELLIDLKREELIRSLYCGTVEDVVIESPTFTIHWNYTNVKFKKKMYECKEIWRNQI